jgi:hypothetical protein
VDFKNQITRAEINQYIFINISKSAWAKIESIYKKIKKYYQKNSKNLNSKINTKQKTIEYLQKL